jgi:hypothetical protein
LAFCVGEPLPVRRCSRSLTRAIGMTARNVTALVDGLERHSAYLFAGLPEEQVRQFVATIDMVMGTAAPAACTP